MRRQGLGQRHPVQHVHHDHQADEQRRVVPEAQHVVPAVGQELGDLERSHRDERSRRDHEHQHDHVQAQCVEPLSHRMAQRRLVVGLDDRVDERRDGRRARPQRDDKAQRHHLAAGALDDVADRRRDDLVDDVAREEAVGRVDDLVLDRRQRLRTEQRSDVGQDCPASPAAAAAATARTRTRPAPTRRKSNRPSSWTACDARCA